MKWFKHLVDSGDDPFIGELIHKFGPRGYYAFFRTLEIMAREFDANDPGTLRVDFQWLSLRYSCRVRAQFLLSFFTFTAKKGRIFYEIDGDYITLKCPKLKELADEYTEKMIRKKSGHCRDKIPHKNQNKKENENIKDKNTTSSGLTTWLRENGRCLTTGWIWNQEYKDFMLAIDMNDAFEAWWWIYPRRVEKKATEEPFKARCKEGLFDEICEGAYGYGQYIRYQLSKRGIALKDYMEYIKHPGTFLKKDRWKEHKDFRYKPKL